MPIHVKDLRGRTKEILWGTMTIQTPLHAQRLGLVDNAHFVHRTMAAVTADTPVNVNGMVEVGIIGEAVDLNPRNRLTGLPAVTDSGKTRAVRQNLALTVAIDAGLRGRQVRVTGHLDETMAIPAVHPQLLHMQCMGEGNWLVRLIADTGVLRCEIVPNTECDGSTDHQAADEQLERKPIGPFGEEIRHSGV